MNTWTHLEYPMYLCFVPHQTKILSRFFQFAFRIESNLQYAQAESPSSLKKRNDTDKKSALKMFINWRKRVAETEEECGTTTKEQSKQFT